MVCSAIKELRAQWEETDIKAGESTMDGRDTPYSGVEESGHNFSEAVISEQNSKCEPELTRQRVEAEEKMFQAEEQENKCQEKKNV